MQNLTLEQRKSLSSFFSNMAVLFFGAILLTPTITNLYSSVVFIKQTIVGVIFLMLSLKVLQD